MRPRIVNGRTRAERIVLMVTGGIVMFVVFGAAIGWLVQLLWNGTVTGLFNFSPITFWQAIGILLLAKIFFGFGGGAFRRPHRGWNRPGHWRKSTTDRDPDAPDEPETYRQYWREEGKAAYEAYLERKAREQRETPEERDDSDADSR